MLRVVRECRRVGGGGGLVGGIRQMASGATMHGTTILSVRKGEKVVVIGDGQCTMGSIVIKPTAKKVRRIGPDGKIVAGFAGATADAFTLLERLETKIEEHPGQLLRACVSLAKDWRMDKFLRRLDSMLVVCDANVSLMVNGGGDVIEPNEGVVAVGSGGPYASAAALAMLDVDGYDAEKIAKKSMEIAANMCVYTNHNFVTEIIDSKEGKLESSPSEDSEKDPDKPSEK
mmetsp:Transcript_4193/g.17790  ORF Transcript_4193/g.17790 Transcript_4193/m.17790 type:complete len:230 (-) Transcript_4193:2486-3175(-)|eukprot:CAMPEP_0113959858 /NCGR_PEP_ID=MMETSP0011_2-20120614/4385_1 /TAXON_ID=101924 /ORGANISM="Rhodosorus marinus" /LENGTH=229 /DNA_ID=CAMNT_0000971231 /DNA_START=81 /DNA_END=770 /DNA_ORIENTATION=+ /assembly_acc=CAM_ASM_000156